MALALRQLNLIHRKGHKVFYLFVFFKEDLIKLTEIEQKILQSARKPLKLKFIELNKPVNTFDRLSSVWTATWLLNLQQPFWSGYMQTVNTGNHPGQASTFFMP